MASVGAKGISTSRVYPRSGSPTTEADATSPGRLASPAFTGSPERVASPADPAASESPTDSVKENADAHAPAAPAGPSVAAPAAPSSVPSLPAPSSLAGPDRTAPQTQDELPAAQVGVDPVAAPWRAEASPQASVDALVDAIAGNDSVTLQIIWQVQRGCRSHCYAMSQTQVAGQVAETVQQAVAVATAGAAAATAVNASRTVQLIVQRQLGCVAFCYGTSQLQLAAQIASTVQAAVALAVGGEASTANVGSTLQLAWQQQVGCVVHCSETEQSQQLSQTAATSQAASASGRAEAEVRMTVRHGRGGRRGVRHDAHGGLAVLRTLVASLAGNANVTVQIVRQVERSDCRSWCVGDTQAQLATQQARTAQEAVATVRGREELTT